MDYLTSTAGPSEGRELIIANYPLNHGAISELLGREVEYIEGNNERMNPLRTGATDANGDKNDG